MKKYVVWMAVMVANLMVCHGVLAGGGFKAPISGTFTNATYTYTHNEDMAEVSAIDFVAAASTNITITSSNVTGIAVTLGSATNTALSVTDGAAARPIVKGGTITFNAQAANTNGHYYVIYLKN